MRREDMTLHDLVTDHAAAVAVVGQADSLERALLDVLEHLDVELLREVHGHDAARLGAAGVRRSVRAVIEQALFTSDLERDLRDLEAQIAINSKITRRKHVMFNIGAIAALIAVAAITAMQGLGNNLGATFNSVSGDLVSAEAESE